MTIQNEHVAHKDLVSGTQTTLHSHAGGGSPPPWHGVLCSNYGDCDPLKMLYMWTMGSVLGPTPTQITTSVARCVQFTPPANTTVQKTWMFGVGATTSLYKIAIYPVGIGSSKIWEWLSSTAPNIWIGNPGTGPYNLIAGTKYWFCITALGTGTTAGYRSLAAPLGTSFWYNDIVGALSARNLSFPVFCQFPVSAGVFPATLPTVVAAAYAGGTTGSVPFAILDSVI